MASPRAAFSILKNLSPNRIQNVSKFRQVLSPKTPVKNLLTVENTLQNKESPIFNIDTPQREKIVNEGLLSQSGKIIGNGAFGVVYKANYKGKEVAAKIINKNKRRHSSINMEKEAAFLKHSNIVKVLKVDEGPALTLITMELCGNSLQSILEENVITKQQRVLIWKFIAKALKYCNEMGVVHADVKPKNILMTADNQPKLTDFGSAVFIDRPNLSVHFYGTPGYAAPEVVRGNIPTPFSDIYSLGVVAWQMLSRKLPFNGMHIHTILYLTGKGKTPSDYYIKDDFQGKYKSLYRKSWSEVPQNRPGLTTIIQELEELEAEIS